MSDEELLTSEEVGRMLKIKAQTVRDAAWRGKLPCVRLWKGRKKTLLRFMREDIDGLIKARRRPATECGDGGTARK